MVHHDVMMWNICYDCFHDMQVQVAHFEPDTIMLTGEGIFPCITFSLPRTEASLNAQADETISTEMDASCAAADEMSLQVGLVALIR